MKMSPTIEEVESNILFRTIGHWPLFPFIACYGSIHPTEEPQKGKAYTVISTNAVLDSEMLLLCD